MPRPIIMPTYTSKRKTSFIEKLSNATTTCVKSFASNTRKIMPATDDVMLTRATNESDRKREVGMEEPQPSSVQYESGPPPPVACNGRYEKQ